MRCKACDSNLTDFEATRKHLHTGEYIELCNPCFKSIEDEVPVVERYDLLGHGDDFEGDGE